MKWSTLSQSRVNPQSGVTVVMAEQLQGSTEQTQGAQSVALQTRPLWKLVAVAMLVKSLPLH